jgi:four helix bundle protein
MPTQFRHEKLIVYERALCLAGMIHHLIPDWDSRHAIKNHLPRAADSIVENIASATAAIAGAQSSHLTYSSGSALECAACFDIAGVKKLMVEQKIIDSKQELLEIFKMLVGLKKSWARSTAMEDTADYPAEPRRGASNAIFHHETLKVYGLALGVVNWLSEKETSSGLSSGAFRDLDKHATGIVLNIAEGNGRFSEPDQRRFLGIAYRSAIKLAAQLDLCVAKGLLNPTCVEAGKDHLGQAASMISLMVKKLANSSK